MVDERTLRFIRGRGIIIEKYRTKEELEKALYQSVLDEYKVSTIEEAFTKYRNSRGFIKAIPKISEKIMRQR
jgi:hypothetical protein